MGQSLLKWAFIVLGGGAGSLARYMLQGWGQTLSKNSFPFGTLFVNVIGCFAIGFLQVLLTGPLLWLRMEYRIGLIVGVLGGFTTFSAFGWETFSLANERQFLRAGANTLASLLLGVSADGPLENHFARPRIRCILDGRRERAVAGANPCEGSG